METYLPRQQTLRVAVRVETDHLPLLEVRVTIPHRVPLAISCFP